jgi:hypothetical protein
VIPPPLVCPDLIIQIVLEIAHTSPGGYQGIQTEEEGMIQLASMQQLV